MVNGMAFSDRLLLQYLQNKATHVDGVRLVYELIAAETGMSVMTVRRAAGRLQFAGLISLTREPGDCYIYKVLSDDRQQSA